MSKGGGVSIPSNYTVKVGGDGTVIKVDSDLDNIHIAEIAPITVNSNIEVKKPIVTESTSKSDSTASLNLKVEPLDVKLEPVKADIDTNSVIDLKPVAVDSCQTIKLAPLPPIHIDQPYSQHFGFTFMGMELWGITIAGKSEMRLHSPGKSQHYSTSMPGHHASKEASAEGQPSVQPRSGLRVRLSE
ncbi:MAG: hypothetical protein V7641_5095 [Blastocatellia bacterium]